MESRCAHIPSLLSLAYFLFQFTRSAPLKVRCAKLSFGRHNRVTWLYRLLAAHALGIDNKILLSFIMSTRLCYCRKCQPPKLLSKRVLRTHLSDDLLHLHSGNHTEFYLEKLLDGIEKTSKSFADFGAGGYILLSWTDVLTLMEI